MKEYFLSTELVGLEGMPNSASGVAQKGRRNNWLSRSAAGSKKVLEYHISNFHPDVKKQLIEKHVTDPREAKLLMALPKPLRELENDDGNLLSRRFIHRLLMEDDGSTLWKAERHNALSLLSELLGEHPLSEEQKELVEHLDETNRTIAADTGEHSNVTEMPNVKSVKEVSQMNDMCAVPVYNVYASCGFGALGDTEYQIRTEFLPCEWLKRFGLTEEIARIIECHGDSMEDTLSDGDEVLVDTRELEHPVKHGVYVVRIGKHVYIKRLKYDIMAEGYEVISDNRELYEPFIVNGDKLQEFAVIGKVVTTVMKAVV